MKSANIFKVCLSVLLLSVFPLIVFAEELDSTNYKIVGAKTSSGGGLGDSTNYSLINSVGKISANPRVYSTNYRLYQEPSFAFLAAQPTIQCFETDTDGSTACTSGPPELLAGGMVAICGGDGCYDKARFEISASSNPSDTLYGIQISTDNFSSDIKYIDGSTFRPESTYDINDFRTETVWETEDFNIQGLTPNTTYYLRISALHGDFTQSDNSIVANATTTTGSIEFDIDIAISTGIDTETAPPYTISFATATELIPGAFATTASTLVWLDIDSSSVGGVSIIQYGKYGGLYSPTTSQTITSDTEDLDENLAEGFGLQSYYIDYYSSSYFGEITAETNYSGTLNSVGAVSTTANKIYSGDGPIKDGRVAMYLKARAGVDKQAASDYGEEIYFVLVPLY
ncbi:MAG: hypothetical protein PHE21_00870 [Candidatus Dojkabacteria bacterium]|nr:hypothetical protein [Candidatus Dojkabacteria bacterium]